MDILLVNPPTLHRKRGPDGRLWIDPAAAQTPYYTELLARTREDGWSTVPGEHLGLQSLQSSLEADGHRVVVLNACVELHASLLETRARIHERDFELIGFTGPLEVFAENLWLARSLREGGYSGHITLGHDFATLNHTRLLALYEDIDSVVRGEGEITMRELARALTDRRPLDEVAGLTFRDGSRVVANVPRSVVANLDELPWVTRPHLRAVVELGLSPSLFTARGCPYQCAFCTTGAVPLAERLRGPERWRRRSAVRVVDELQYLRAEFGVRHVTIVDDLYLAKGAVGAARAIEIAEEILERGLDIRYMIDCRVDGIDRDVFRLLWRSGLRKVFLGVENGSDDVLRAFHKGYPASRIRDALRILRDLGIDYVAGFIMFNPTERLDDVERSCRLLAELQPTDFALFLEAVRIYPGTRLQVDLERQGLLRGEFPDYTATYVDPHVARLRDTMAEFGRLAMPLLVARVVTETADGRSISAAAYELVSHAFAEMIDCCKRRDDEGVDAALAHLVAQFREVAAGGHLRGR